MQRCTGSCVQNRPYTTPLGNPCEKHNMGPCLQITGKKIEWLPGSSSSFFPERGVTKLITEITFPFHFRIFMHQCTHSYVQNRPYTSRLLNAKTIQLWLTFFIITMQVIRATYDNDRVTNNGTNQFLFFLFQWSFV